MGTNEQLDDNSSAIAIIGFAGRFPGASDLEQFWENLRDGIESISSFSDEELVASGIPPASLRSPNYVKRGSLLPGVDLFDADFFGVPPREAALTDPQQRIFLETSWEALEHAGYAPGTFDEVTGVYAGSSANTYFLERIAASHEIGKFASPLQLKIGNEKDFLCTRVAHQLNLHGPAVNVQTACSTSLVAVHLACQSILNGECDVALAGGVSATAFNKQGYFYTEGGIDSPDGHCRPFDEDACGTVGGNGVGVVVLKNLSAALADRDTVHAVIIGTAINNDGNEKVGFTAPSVNGQAAVVAEAISAAGVSPSAISYIETHGTGTKLGDPIEMKALRQAFSEALDNGQFCAIGSVKANIGHLDAAAGIAGLIKTVLSLKHREIPPSLHFKQPNPHIDFASSPFYVNSTRAHWPTSNEPRRAGVSSFGIGGTNAHAVLEEAPRPEATHSSRSHHAIVLSAATPTALENAVDAMRRFLSGNPGAHLADIAFTSQIGRRHFLHRHVVVADCHSDAAAQLARFKTEPFRTERSGTERSSGEPADACRRGPIFIFPAHGAQQLTAASDMFRSEPLFRSVVQQCARELTPIIGYDLADAMLGDRAGGLDRMRDDGIAAEQPALFIVEYALARQLEEWGIRPSGMVGEGVGEYVAACLAGVLDLTDALHLVAYRARMLAALPKGAMLSVNATESSLRPLLDKEHTIAAIHAPAVCLVASPLSSMDQLIDRLLSHRISFQRCPAEPAPLNVESICADYASRLSRINFRSPRIPYVSTATATWITGAKAVDPQHWIEQLCGPSRLSESLATVANGDALLAVGPGSTLCEAARHSLTGVKASKVLSTFPDTPTAQATVFPALLSALGQLWLDGLAPDWLKFQKHQCLGRVPIPTYAFDRKPHMLELPPPQPIAKPSAKHLYGKRPDIRDWLYSPSWKRSLDEPPHVAPRSTRDIQVFFCDGSELCERLVRTASSGGHPSIMVREGREYSVSDSTHFIDPTAPEHFSRVFAQVMRLAPAHLTINYFWTTPPPDASQPCEGEEKFLELLHLAQALAAQRITVPVEVNVVTCGVHAVTGEERLSPMRATLLGVIQVLPIELPNVRCRNVDLAQASVPDEALIGRLAREIHSEANEQIVAYRGNYRWIRTFEQASHRRPSVLPRLRERGHYLITGGLGGIGLAFARYLADRTPEVSLTICGRTVLPDRDIWDAHCHAHGEDDHISRRIRSLLALERTGAKVAYVAADVACAEDVDAMKDASSAAFGPMHGVFHAAGLSNSSSRFGSKSPTSVRELMSPKVVGARLLKAAFDSDALDFLLLCSSASTIAPTKGQMDYCAANWFLDAFAHACNLKNGASVMSVNWSTWGDSGMALAGAEKLTAEELLQRQLYLENCISTEDAPGIFDRVLASAQRQVLVTPVSLDAMLQGTETLNRMMAGVETGATTQATDVRPALSTDFKPATTDLEIAIGGIWEDLFGISRIGMNDDFFELGGHSLLATQVLSRIRQSLGVALPLDTLFEAPTIAGLASKVEEHRVSKTNAVSPVGQASESDIRRSVEAMSEAQIVAMLNERKNR